MTSKLLSGVALIATFLLGAYAIDFIRAEPETRSADPNASVEIPSENHNTDDVVFSDLEKDQIRALIRETLLNQPELIFEAIDIYQDRQQRIAFDVLFSEQTGYIAGGNPETAKVAVIELMDYHCGACKEASGDVRDLTLEQDDVVVAFREYPILRQESLTAAEIALAARDQGKYVDLHFALMDEAGVLTEDRLYKIAGKLGLDEDKLRTAARSLATQDAIMETVNTARNLGINGTPAFIVASLEGDFLEVLNGDNPASLQGAIDNARAASADAAP